MGTSIMNFLAWFVFLWIVAAGTTGCSGVTAGLVDSGEYGYFEMRGDAEGIRAFSDYAQGIIDNTKTPEGQESSHYKMRREQNKYNVVRFRNKKVIPMGSVSQSSEDK